MVEDIAEREESQRYFCLTIFLKGVIPRVVNL